jgi:hypothetical protein
MKDKHVEDDFERTQRRIAQLKVRIADAAMEEYRLSIMLAGSFTSEVEAEKKTMWLCAELAALESETGGRK